MKPFLLIIVSILLGAVGQVLMKWGTLQSAASGTDGLWAVVQKYATSLPILAGLSCYALSAFIWIFAIAKVELSYAYPMVALSYIAVVIMSYFFFGEAITPLRLAGLATIIIGVLLIARS